jgi:hypothetical protein
LGDDDDAAQTIDGEVGQPAAAHGQHRAGLPRTERPIEPAAGAQPNDEGGNLRRQPVGRPADDDPTVRSTTTLLAIVHLTSWSSLVPSGPPIGPRDLCTVIVHRSRQRRHSIVTYRRPPRAGAARAFGSSSSAHMGTTSARVTSPTGRPHLERPRCRGGGGRGGERSRSRSSARTRARGVSTGIRKCARFRRPPITA